MKELILPEAATTQKLGICLAKVLPSNSVVLLEGELGAGKTTLVQGMGIGLNISEMIVSPTFTLINEYLSGDMPLYHLDLYRLESQEVEQIYPETYWEGIEVTPGITVIEWAELLTYLPENYLRIKLKIDTNLSRRVTIEQFGDFQIDEERFNFRG